MNRFKEFYTEDDKPELVLPIGIPGSGKSTWIKEFNKGNKYKIVSPDEIRREMADDISDQSMNAQVFQMAEEATKRFLEGGDSVIYDATNVDTEKRRSLIKQMPKDIKLKAKIFEIDPEESKRRIRKDIEAGKDRSDVPDHIIDKMQKKFEETKSKIKEEGFELI